jgi:hypothetical protein
MTSKLSRRTGTTGPMDDTMQRRMVDTAQRGDSLNGEILPPGPPWHTRRAPTHPAFSPWPDDSQIS